MAAESPSGACRNALEKPQRLGGNISVVGITGGIATGKSLAAEFLSDRLSAYFVSADDLCRKLLLPRNRGWEALRAMLNSSFFLSGGDLDRVFLREKLFADAKLRQEINAVLHPLVREEIFTALGTCEGDLAGHASSANPAKDADSSFSAKAGLCVVEVPLLFEAGWKGDFERTVLVYADYSVSLRRLLQRDNVSLQQAKQSLAAQMPLGEKIMLADHVVNNSGVWSVTCIELIRLADLVRSCCKS